MMMRPGPLAVIQARLGSTRLPRKVLAPLGSLTLLGLLVERCRRAQRLGGILIATTDRPGDDSIVAEAVRLGVPVIRGSEEDVLGRFLLVAEAYPVEIVVRLTADNPLVDPAAIDAVVELRDREDADLAWIEGYPVGLGDAEAVRVGALRRAAVEMGPSGRRYREHVTPYLIDHPERFRLAIGEAPAGLRRRELRLTVDEEPDLAVIRWVRHYFGPRVEFGTAEIIAALEAHPEVVARNAHVRQRAP
jgi:spore coat polysaccharide biosynthesis protein SpsF